MTEPTSPPDPAPIAFGPQVCADLGQGGEREWLLADGLGGYAMGTVSGLRTRRYHGLLTAATGLPVRMLGLAALVLGIRFRAGGATEYEPTDLDFDLIHSWLGRAYPTPTVLWSRATVDGPQDWPFNADDVNAFLRAVRFQDVASGTDARWPVRSCS